MSGQGKENQSVEGFASKVGAMSIPGGEEGTTTKKASEVKFINPFADAGAIKLGGGEKGVSSAKNGGDYAGDQLKAVEKLKELQIEHDELLDRYVVCREWWPQVFPPLPCSKSRNGCSG